MIDKKTFLAFILIAAVMVLWTLTVPQPVPQREAEQTETEKTEQLPVDIPQDAKQAKDGTSRVVVTTPAVSKADLVEFTIQTPLYTAIISNEYGGSIRSFKLSKYFRFDSVSVDLASIQNHKNLVLSGISTESGPFTLDESWAIAGVSDGETFILNDESKTVSFETVLDGRRVYKTLVFNPDSYLINTSVDFSMARDIISQGVVTYEWEGGLPPTEKNVKDDASYFKAYLFQGDEVIEPDIDDYEDGPGFTTYTGQTDWVAVRTKYFISALIPSIPAAGAKTSGITENKHDIHNVALLLNADERQDVSLFLGPLEYKRIRGLGVELQKTMSLGFAPIRPISRGILYLMQQLYVLIPNYGFVLIIFSILVKIAVYPLTNKSYESTRKMQAIQPLITELKNKHKNDPQKLNKATMGLYKEHGVNPLGGCLPILLQMPLLFALFQVFRSTIDLRGASFILWITDLSTPDTLTYIAGFPLNILPLVMVVTMLLQQKMTPAQGGAQQKTTMYVMNVFFLFLFYNFPSGLNLYYTLFNALTILQQKFLTPHTPIKVPVKTKKKK